MKRWRAARTLAGFARRLGLGANPLRRRVDRTERLTLFGTTLLALVAVPFAVLIGSVVHHRVLAAANSQATTRHQVTATLTEAAPPPIPARGAQVVALANARWRDVGGMEHRGLVPVVRGAVAGARVSIWTTESGVVTDPPLTPSAAIAQAWLAGTGIMLGVIAVLAGVFRLVRRRLNRIRAAAWEAEWCVIGPQWTSRAS